MAAGVHRPILAGKGQAALLRHRQCVDVAAQQNGLARLAQGDHHAGLAADFALDARFGQLAHDAVHRIAHIKAHACVGVDVAPVFHDLSRHLLRALQILVHLLSSSCF